MTFAALRSMRSDISSDKLRWYRVFNALGEFWLFGGFFIFGGVRYMTENKKAFVLHTVLSNAARLLFAGCLIRFLAVYPSLDREIGIHFDGKGAFDIVDKKIYGFYPFAVSLAILLFCALFCFLARKAKKGERVSEKGDRLTRAAVTLYVDVSQLAMVFFFSGAWSDCVIRQQALNIHIGLTILFTLFGLLFVLVIFMIAMRIACRIKE